MAKKLHFILASLLLLMASCQQSQSELDFDSLTMTAVVTGYIEYDAGVNTASANYSEQLILPAAGKTIFAEVEYREYTGSSDSKKIYETVTDSLGRYTLNIPTTSKGVDAVIRMQDFTASKSVYEGVKDGAPIFRTDSTVYSFTKSVSALKAGSYDFASEDQDVMCSEKTYASGSVSTTAITLTGNVSLAIENGFRDGSYSPAAGADLKFNIEVNYSESNPNYNPGASNNFQAYTTAAKCDDAGNYSVTIPIESYEDGLTITSVVIGEGSAYTHYYAAGKSMELTGAYVSSDVLNNKSITSIIDQMNYKLPDLYLKFTPNYNNSLTDAEPTPSTWTTDLAGWECYNGYTEYATITGEYLTPIETAFATGAYANPTQEACVRITYPNASGRASKDLYVNTDANGKYSFEVPVSDAAEKLYAIAMPNSNNTEFTHYSSASETEVVEGAYTATNAVKTSKLWNEIGKQYFKFTPNSAPSTWNSDLAGWQEGSAEFDGTATVSAKVYMAKETGFATGEYAAATDGTIVSFNVSQYVGDEETSTSYNAVVSGGAISTEVYTIGDADPKVTITSVGNSTVTDFVHYKVAGGTTKLTGSYNTSSPKTIPANAEDRSTWNQLGDIYLPFNPETSTMPADFYTTLAGWQIAENPIESAVTFTAEILKAVENSYLVGSFSPATEAKTASIYITPKGASSSTEYIVPVVNGKISAAITYDKGNTSENPDIVLHMNNIEVENFTHFLSDGSKITTNGEYSFYAYDGYWTGLDQDERESFNKLGTAYLKFYPTSTPTDFYSNLAGWQIAENPIENAVTFTADIVKAVENSYLMGSFIPATEAKMATISITPQGSYSSTEYIVPVVNGKISAAITYDKGNSNDDPTVSLSMSNIEVKNFNHFSADGSKLATKGIYAFNPDYGYWSGAVQDDRESFNDLGTAYLAFYPDAAPADYDSRLAGWKVTDKKLIENPVTFTANVFEAVENGFATGSFAAATHNMKAVIGIMPNGATDFDIYAVPVINGKISASIAYEYGDGSEPYVSLAIADNKVDDFKHYSANKSSKKIEGEYSLIQNNSSYWEGFDPADRESFSALGDCYLTFNCTDTSITDFTNILAGWVRTGTDQTRITKSVTGSIKKAIETGYLAGKYVPAANEFILIEYGSDRYIGATDNDGNYSIDINYTTEPTRPSDVSVFPLFTYGSDYSKYDATGKETVVQNMNFSPVYSSLNGKNVNSYTWNSRGEIYYRANNPTDENILEWVNTILALEKKYTKTITVKFAAKQQAAKYDTATSTVSAIWNSYTATMPTTIAVNGVLYTAITSGEIRQMRIFVDDDSAKDGAALDVQVLLDDSSIKDTPATFTHYYYDMSDPMAARLQTETIYGKYSSPAVAQNSATPVANGVATVSDKDSTTNFNQVVFTLADPTTPPTEWNYIW